MPRSRPMPLLLQSLPTSNRLPPWKAIIMVSRVYVEKKPGFDVEAQQLLAELHTAVPEGLAKTARLRLINCYDVEGIDEELFERCIPTVFSEPQVDDASREFPVAGVEFSGKTAKQLAAEGADISGIAAAPANVHVLAVEALPGQFDQRADSAVAVHPVHQPGRAPRRRLHAGLRHRGRAALTMTLAAVKHYVINPVETREACLVARETLQIAHPTPKPVEVIEGFLDLDEAGLSQFIEERGLAMDLADIAFCQQYFAGEKRCPTITEIKMIDTYWSDHCRHTTFGTELTDVVDRRRAGARRPIERYLELRHELGRDEKPVCLMDMGTIGAKLAESPRHPDRPRRV